MASLEDRYFTCLGERSSRAGAEWERLRCAWTEPHRAYHTLAHLTECLDLLSEAVPANGPAVELAIWYHDAVYDTRAHDNEARSADWAVSTCAAFNLPDAELVHALIMATRHSAGPRTTDECVTVDVDLAILGASPIRFAQYERQVRTEYSWVPEDAFRVGRTAILEGFLSRANIYHTRPFQQRFEARARANLAEAISRLGSVPG